MMISSLAEFVFRAFRKAKTLGVPESLLERLRPQALTVATHIGQMHVPWQFVPHYTMEDYEPLTRRSMEELLRPGMTLVDVGAHIGWLSVLASQIVGSKGRVFAIEPFQENLAYIRRNLELNACRNVTVLPFAVGKDAETRSFNVTASSDSNSFFDHPNIVTERSVAVDVRPLDELISGPVDAIKIDVEGAELLALDGMRATLERNPKVVLWVEWMPRCLIAAGYKPLDLPARLLALGFDHLEVLEDTRRVSTTVEDVAARLASDELPRHWYANIVARRTLQ